jgi:hypothetical protein
VTEGTEHVIDPDGDARRALLEAVAEHGPEALSDATIMDNLCRNQLAALPGESILIVSAARADVPALLRDKIPELGNYGAIQSVAATLAQASDLDGAASLWVVREFGRALGMIAPGGTQPIPRVVPGGPPAEAAADGAGAQPQGTPGAGVPPPSQGSSRSRRLNRNTIGVAAAIALVAGYLGVAAAAHLSPFPAETVAAASSQPPSTGASTGPSTGPSTSTSPAGSPDASPDASPTSDFDALLSKIPASVQGHNNCQLIGTQYGATAVIQCSRLNSGAGTIQYYLYPSPARLTSGVSALLSKAGFHRQQPCTTGSEFTDFLAECQSDFHNQTPFMTGSIAEYTNTSHDPLIVTTDNQQNVMAVLVGTNPGDLLAYWKQLNWIVR